MSRHIPEKEFPDLKKKIEQREAYRSNCPKLKKRLEYLAPLRSEWLSTGMSGFSHSEVKELLQGLAAEN